MDTLNSNYNTHDKVSEALDKGVSAYNTAAALEPKLPSVATLPATLEDNTIYKGAFQVNSTLTAPADNKLGVIIDKATISGTSFSFTGDYVGDIPENGKTYVITIIDGVWSFNEVYTKSANA